MTWKKTGVSSGNVSPGDLVGVDVEGTPIVLVNLAGTVHALQGECPHLGASLAEGIVSDRRLTCSLHEAAFDIETGAVQVDPFGIEPPGGEVPAARTHPVRVDAGEIWVDLP